MSSLINSLHPKICLTKPSKALIGISCFALLKWLMASTMHFPWDQVNQNLYMEIEESGIKGWIFSIYCILKVSKELKIVF